MRGKVEARKHHRRKLSTHGEVSDDEHHHPKSAEKKHVSDKEHRNAAAREELIERDNKKGLTMPGLLSILKKKYRILFSGLAYLFLVRHLRGQKENTRLSHTTFQWIDFLVISRQGSKGRRDDGWVDKSKSR